MLAGNGRDAVEGRRDESCREAEPSEAGFCTLPRARSHTLAPTAAGEPRSSWGTRLCSRRSCFKGGEASSGPAYKSQECPKGSNCF